MYDVIGFARMELDDYLDKLGVQAEISLGLMDERSDSHDKFSISITDCKGHIAGSNPRSVLFGVYTLLERWGVRFLHPGEGGTYIPKSTKAPDTEIEESAAYDHRVMCIEGSVSLENVIDTVDWCAKMKFNGYFIQFDDAFIFFDRWYSHRNSTHKGAESFCADDARELVRRVCAEVKKRGLSLHRMGHCWTCNPFGVKMNGWDEIPEESIPDSYKNICAEVGGVRRVWQNMPLSTQLCYSREDVRKVIVRAVVDFARREPYADVIHFWLGDYFNNYCECPECMKKTVSDHYATLINEVTAALMAEGFGDKRIVIICGYNCAYPPTETQLLRTDRVILMFAPISRTYSKSFPHEFLIKGITPPAHNKFTNPRSVGENLAYLWEWERIFPSDVVDFDYHLMWDHVFDAGGEGIARILHRDIENLSALGMSGFISCQVQRAAFPTSLAMTVMARTLWWGKSDFAKIRRELYRAYFGKGARQIGAYLKTLSRAFDIGCIRGQKKFRRERFRRDMEAAILAMHELPKHIEALDVHDPFIKENLRVLLTHAKIYTPLGEIILLHLDERVDEARKRTDALCRLVWESEDEIQPLLDCYYFDTMVKIGITPNKETPFADE